MWLGDRFSLGRNIMWSRVLAIFQALAWLLPASPVKNWILSRLGHKVHPTATVRSNFVWKIDRVSLEQNSCIGVGNTVRNIALLALGRNSSVGNFNVISAHPVYASLSPSAGRLEVGDGAFVTGKHYLDCSGSIRIGSMAALAGHGTQILTHTIDLRIDAQTARPVEIGTRSFVGTRCLILSGSILPPRSILAPGSVLRADDPDMRPGLWAGAPAIFKMEVQGAWFDRSQSATRTVFVGETGESIENAF